MKCEQCGGKTEIKRGIYQYVESGLDNVYLVNVDRRVCESCGAVAPRIPHINELHAVIGRAIALKGEPLSGSEARYLRKHLGLKGKEWAELLRVDVTTLSRWEGEEQKIGPQSDLLLRLLYFSVLAERGAELPERLTERIAAIAEPRDDELAVIIDPAKRQSYRYSRRSEVKACTC
jgi:YgiT-type zinc finger domain-containing protein